MQAKFSHPVFRVGKILQLCDGKSLTYQQANLIGDVLEDPVTGAAMCKKYREAREPLFRALDPDFVWPDDVSSSLILVRRMTPIVRFAAVQLRWKGKLWIFKDIITICFEKSRSKIWSVLSPGLKDEDGKPLFDSDHPADSILGLQREVFAILERGIDELIPFYERIVLEVVPPLSPVQLEVHKKIYLSNFGTRSDIQESMALLRRDRVQWLDDPIAPDALTFQELCEDYFHKSKQDLSLYVQTSLPRHKPSDSFFDTLPRESVVFADSDERSERYMGLSWERDPFIENARLQNSGRFINTELSNKSLSFEIGRAF